jgi:hypothetical protein
MPVEAALPAFEHRRARALARRSAEAHFGAAQQPVQRRARDAVVDRVDHAAGGVAAVQQRGRPAQHLEALDHQRVDRRGMVEAQARRVDRRAAVVEQSDAVAIQSADDRPARLRTEAAGRHAGQARQRVAERAGAGACECVTAKHAGRRPKLAAQGVAGDDDGGGG